MPPPEPAGGTPSPGELPPGGSVPADCTPWTGAVVVVEIGGSDDEVVVPEEVEVGVVVDAGAAGEVEVVVAPMALPAVDVGGVLLVEVVAGWVVQDPVAARAGTDVEAGVDDAGAAVLEGVLLVEVVDGAVVGADVVEPVDEPEAAASAAGAGTVVAVVVTVVVVVVAVGVSTGTEVTVVVLAGGDVVVGAAPAIPVWPDAVGAHGPAAAGPGTDPPGVVAPVVPDGLAAGAAPGWTPGSAPGCNWDPGCPSAEGAGCPAPGLPDPAGLWWPAGAGALEMTSGSAPVTAAAAVPIPNAAAVMKAAALAVNILGTTARIRPWWRAAGGGRRNRALAPPAAAAAARAAAGRTVRSPASSIGVAGAAAARTRDAR